MRRPSTMELELLVPLAVAIWAILAWVVAQTGAPASVALPVTGTFLLFGPGLAAALLLRLRGTALLLTVAVGGSLAASILVGQVLLVVGSYQPGLVVTALTVTTIGGCLFQASRVQRGRSDTALADEVR